MHVEDYDESGWPARGAVLQRSASRKKITAALVEGSRAGTLPQAYCVFRAVPFEASVGGWLKTLAKPGIEQVDG